MYLFRFFTTVLLFCLDISYFQRNYFQTQSKRRKEEICEKVKTQNASRKKRQQDVINAIES